MRTKLTTYIIVFLCLAEVGLTLLSWLLSTMMTDGVRSLLSSEGIRWFCGHYVDILQSPVLIWLLLTMISYGVCMKSHLLSKPTCYRERMGLRIALSVLFGYILVILSLTFIPHAILLSATGNLFPSPFSRAIVPILSFGIVLVSVSYGLATRTFCSVMDICQAMSEGIARWSSLFLIYILFMQFYESLCFIFF